MFRRILVIGLLPVVLAANAPLNPAAAQNNAAAQKNAPAPDVSALWEAPADLSSRDLFNGPWGAAHAPDPNAVYTYVRPKKGGTNPGLIVQDPRGREWHVKQPPHTHQGAEGPVEVTLSRVLSAIGYHQPPVYFLDSFLMTDGSGTHRVPGGRFRLSDPNMKGRGEWSWQANPFLGTRPYGGLLVVLLTFNSADLKNSNNTVYDVGGPGGRSQQWYVVRDIGSALGSTRHFTPMRNNLPLFERQIFITGVRNGIVQFDYHGWHSDMVNNRVTPADVGWAMALLSRLSDRQWSDAFRAGGYAPDVADRYIQKLHANIARAEQISGDQPRLAREGR